MGFRDRLTQSGGLLSGTGFLEGLPQGGLLQGLGSKLMNRRRGAQGDLASAGMDPAIDPSMGSVGYAGSSAIDPNIAMQDPMLSAGVNGRQFEPVSPIARKGGPTVPPSTSDTLRNTVVNKYNVGDLVSEDDLEGIFPRKGDDPKNYPQTSVQDYSEVKEDKEGKYIHKLND